MKTMTFVSSRSIRLRALVWAIATIATLLLVWMVPQGAYGITRVEGYTYNNDRKFLYPYLTYYYIDREGLMSFSATTHERDEQMSPTCSASDPYDNSQSSNGGVMRELHMTFHPGNESSDQIWLEYRVKGAGGWSGWVRADHGSSARTPDGGDVKEIEINVKGALADRYTCVYNVHAAGDDTAHNGRVRANSGISAHGNGRPLDGFHANISIKEYPVSYRSSFTNGRAGASLGTHATTYRDKIPERYTQAPTGYAYQGSDNAGQLCTGDTVVNVKFSPISYRVVFDGNGALAGDTPPLDMVYDAPTAAPASGFERDGWTFAGWARAPGERPAYETGDELLNLADKEGAVVTLYATWELDMSKLSFSIPTTIPLRVLPSGEVVAPQQTYIENLSPWPIALDAARVSVPEDASIKLASTVDKSLADVVAVRFGKSGSLLDAAATQEGSRLAAEDVVLGQRGAADARLPLVWESNASAITRLSDPVELCDVTWSVSPRPS